MGMEGRRGEWTPPRQRFYPRWGMEEPVRRSNAHSLYRCGDKGFLTRLIIPAKEGRKYFKYGLSIGEFAIILAVLAFLKVMGDAVGIGIEGYLQVMGW